MKFTTNETVTLKGAGLFVVNKEVVDEVTIEGTGAVQYVAINPAESVDFSYWIGETLCKEKKGAKFVAKSIYNLNTLNAPAATVNGVAYETLAAALEAAAEGATIELLADAGDVTISQACTINAGTYTINITAGEGLDVHNDGATYVVYEPYMVYVYNANKTAKTYIHAWIDGGESYTTWPGKEITENTTTINGYTYNVYQLPYNAMGKKVSFVVNNGSDSCKSADFTVANTIEDDVYLLFHKYAVTETTTIPNIVYLKPGSNWNKDGAKFGVHMWDASNNAYDALMTDNNSEGIYNIIVPSDKEYNQIIFVRLNNATTEFSWDSKWNQTGNLTLYHTNKYFDTKDWYDNHGDDKWTNF